MKTCVALDGERESKWTNLTPSSLTHPLSLSNLFNCIEKTPAYAQVSVAVYQAIITVAAAGDEMELVFPTLASVDKWIEEWKVDVEIVRSLYLFISEKLGACQDL